jgi:hypothetical protein
MFSAAVLATPLDSGNNAVGNVMANSPKIHLARSEQSEVGDILRAGERGEKNALHNTEKHAADRGREIAHHELKDEKHAAERGREIAKHRPHYIRSEEAVESIEATEASVPAALRAPKLPKLPKLGRFPKAPKFGKLGKLGKVPRLDYVEGIEEVEK